MNDYVVIFIGEDGEPDPWNAKGKSPRHAVLRLIRTWINRNENFRRAKWLYRGHYNSLHGVYPGKIGPRVLTRRSR